MTGETAGVSSFYTAIKAEINLFCNSRLILEKVELDGTLQALGNMFSNIFTKEALFTVNELRKLKDRDRGLEIQRQLYTNTLIFKENIKLICGALIESTWRENLRAEKVDETIQQAKRDMLRGNFAEIKETEEEHICSQLISGEESERVLSQRLEQPSNPRIASVGLSPGDSSKRKLRNEQVRTVESDEDTKGITPDVFRLTLPSAGKSVSDDLQEDPPYNRRESFSFKCNAFSEQVIRDKVQDLRAPVAKMSELSLDLGRVQSHQVTFDRKESPVSSVNSSPSKISSLPPKRLYTTKQHLKRLTIPITCSALSVKTAEAISRSHAHPKLDCSFTGHPFKSKKSSPPSKLDLSIQNLRSKENTMPEFYQRGFVNTSQKGKGSRLTQYGKSMNDAMTMPKTMADARNSPSGAQQDKIRSQTADSNERKVQMPK